MTNEQCRLCLQNQQPEIEDLFDKSSPAAVAVLEKIEMFLQVKVHFKSHFK